MPVGNDVGAQVLAKHTGIAPGSHKDIRWKTVCVASTLVALATVVRFGIGPMIVATLPEGCRVQDRSSVSEETRHLVDVLSRQSVLGRP